MEKRKEHTSTLSIVGRLGLLYADQGKIPVTEKMYLRGMEGKAEAQDPAHSVHRHRQQGGQRYYKEAAEAGRTGRKKIDFSQ